MTDRSRDDDVDKPRFGLPGGDLLTEIWNHPLDYPRIRSGVRKRDKKSRAATLVVLVVAGLLFSAAYRHTVAAEPAAAEAREDLREDIAAQRDDNDSLAGAADELHDDVARLRDELLGDQEEVERLHDDEALAGLRAVTGDGVAVDLADGPADAGGSDPGKIFDRDLQLVVNTLWAYGAEAIAVDGRRLTATSSIRSAGEAIMVDFAPVSSPYEITAIGPDDLADSFEQSTTADTFSDYAAEYGISMTVSHAWDLTLPAASPPALDNAETEDAD